MKKLEYNQLMKMIDDIDEYIYNHKEVLESNKAVIDHKLATNNKTASFFRTQYKYNPTEAIIALIYDHFKPVAIQTGNLIQRIPTGSKAKTSPRFITGVIKTFKEHHNHYYVPKKSAKKEVASL